MSENCSIIVDTLIEQRHKKGMTQKELAKVTSLTQSIIARLESKKTTPQLDTLLKVASALGCDIAVVPGTDLPTGKPVGFQLLSVACNRTSFSDFGIQVYA